MDVTVELHGHLRQVKSAGNGGGGPLQLSLPDGATAGDLLGRIADRLGARAAAALAKGPRLPEQVRLFVDGQIAHSCDQPLAAAGQTPSSVTVVLLSPISGGA